MATQFQSTVTEEQMWQVFSQLHPSLQDKLLNLSM